MQFLIFEAAFNYIGQILINEYDQKTNKEIHNKIKCINKMYMYTHMLKTEYDILNDKYYNLESKHNKEIQKLKNKLDEANDTIRFADLGSKRFGKKND
tara:strand:- start:4190 stop:4483 length:294 start_codon:yes stop_codon:yes gene_type:complete